MDVRRDRPPRDAVASGWNGARSRLVALASLVLLGSLGTPSAVAGWKAGTGRAVITPEGPIWMAGYASRTGPSEGVIHDLWAKALALESPDGGRAVLVTLDLCGIGRDLSVPVRDAIQAKHKLDRARVVLACSHTHTGPVVKSNLIDMYPLDDEQRRRVEDYVPKLRAAIFQAVDRAFEALGPADLSWESGRADFAVNRRENNQPKAAELRAELTLKGPVDHDVPVLRVGAPGGRLVAVVCGYACHCTTLSLNKLSGDYAGFAQIELERSHPGAQAMFVAGCGADQNPLPRGTVAHAERYGHALAEAVERVLAGPLRPVTGALAPSYGEIDLTFGTIPDRAHWESAAGSKNPTEANRAKRILKELDGGGSLPPAYPYPIQVWRLGDDLTWILLGGEVVVDYSLRLKRNLGSSRTWVSAYCNDVMAYVPSLRVLKEGGYEGGGAMLPYGLPAPWSEKVEDQIFDAIRKQLAP